MLIVLPPSEGKTRPETGPALDLESLSFPQLTKTRELLLRIAAILRRAKTEKPGSLTFGDFTFNLERGELLKGDEVIALTSGESVLLKSLASTPGVPISREDLSATSGSQGRAVDVQITRLRRKIEKDPKAPRHLQTVRGEGYVLWAD